MILYTLCTVVDCFMAVCLTFELNVLKTRQYTAECLIGGRKVAQNNIVLSKTVVCKFTIGSVPYLYSVRCVYFVRGKGRNETSETPFGTGNGLQRNKYNSPLNRQGLAKTNNLTRGGGKKLRIRFEFPNFTNAYYITVG